MNGQPTGVPTLLQVQAKFATSAQMQDAVTKLSMAGFDRADMSLPSQGVLNGTQTPESGTKPAATEADARQARTLGASTAATAAALAAAGVTVATGGAAAPALAAAVLAGGAAGGSVFAIHKAANQTEQQDRENRAENDTLILAVRATTAAKRSEAAAIMQAAGATDIETTVD